MSWEDRIIEKVDIERWRNKDNTVEARATRLYNRRIRALHRYNNLVGINVTYNDTVLNNLYNRCLEEVQSNESNIK